jgi:hypothetical protein
LNPQFVDDFRFVFVCSIRGYYNTASELKTAIESAVSNVNGVQVVLQPGRRSSFEIVVSTGAAQADPETLYSKLAGHLSSLFALYFVLNF